MTDLPNIVLVGKRGTGKTTAMGLLMLYAGYNHGLGPSACDGCATEDSYWDLVEAGYVGVCIECDEHIAMDRLWRAGRNPNRELLQGDSYDGSISDYRIDNNGDLEQLREGLRTVLRAEQRRV